MKELRAIIWLTLEICNNFGHPNIVPANIISPEYKSTKMCLWNVISPWLTFGRIRYLLLEIHLKRLKNKLVVYLFHLWILMQWFIWKSLRRDRTALFRIYPLESHLEDIEHQWEHIHPLEFHLDETVEQGDRIEFLEHQLEEISKSQSPEL